MSTVTSATRGRVKYKLADGTEVPGVTTVLRVLDKPQLVIWANRLGLKGIDSTKYVDELADIGKLTHYLVECDINGSTPDTRAFSMDQLSQAEKCFQSWKNWRKGKTVEPILQEASFVSEAHRYGGTIDQYIRVDGVPTLLDIKTAKGIYDEMVYQVVAYDHLMKENGHQPEEAKILRIGRSDDETFEEKPIDTTGIKYRLQWDLFLRCLDVYNLQKLLRKA
jgi:hypothetical protein